MFVCKMGGSHIELGINCQDYGFDLDKYKLICDGCSDARHSEVGVKLFSRHLSYLLKLTDDVWRMDSIIAREKMTILIQSAFDTTRTNIFCDMQDFYSNCKDWLAFTTLFCGQTENEFVVTTVGDGYIITLDNDDNIEFVDICKNGCDEYPEYFLYSELPQNMLGRRDSSLEGKPVFNYFTYDKSMYKKVGLSSDGIRFAIGTPLEDELKEVLKSGSAAKLKRFVNKNQSVFKDDVSISL